MESNGSFEHLPETQHVNLFGASDTHTQMLANCRSLSFSLPGKWRWVGKTPPHVLSKKTALWRNAWLLFWLRYFFNFLPLVITIIKPWLGEYVCFCPTTSSKSKFTTICMVRIFQCMSSFLVWILAGRDYIISMDSHIWDEDGIDKLKLNRKHIPLFGLFKVMFYLLSC